jgi:hypothetical protein
VGDGATAQQASPPGAACMGGHGTSPYEQKTQQSPGRGRSREPQPAQRWKNWQASVGIVSSETWPHSGQVRREVRMSEGMMEHDLRTGG